MIGPAAGKVYEMKKQTLIINNERYLRLPYEINAPLQNVILTGENGTVRKVRTKLSLHRVDLWMEYPLDGFAGHGLTVSAENGWVQAASLCEQSGQQKRSEALRPHIHYAPATGSLQALNGLAYTKNDCWICSVDADPLSPQGCNKGIATALSSRDLLHWKPSDAVSTPDASQPSHSWLGDIAEERSVRASEAEYVLAISSSAEFPGLAAGTVLSLPAEKKDGLLRPLLQVSNLRVWERHWHCEPLKKEFSFDMRFQLAPDVWPEIRLLDKTNTATDIRTDACEVEMELFVGQETEITVDLCGQNWRWEALTQTISCGKYTMPAKALGGRIRLHFYSDMIVQELFNDTDRGMLILLPNGPATAWYKIKSDLVENINNDSFCVQYYRDSYLKISAVGSTATLIELKVYGLRDTVFSSENQKLLNGVMRGRPLYKGQNYIVYENCVEDRIYGDPPAWALDNGRVVLSPVRAVEEFCWRDTPWGDMTRIVNRSEKWEAPSKSEYPQLETDIPVLSASYQLAADVMTQNLSETYALPGQKGLMNAALFQGPGEGFGIWVRDACHSAFRIQNLLVPHMARESLVYVSERGFNNGVDCAAMPAIAIWDYYVATGDRSILFETLPGVLKYVAEADSRFVPKKGLISASMCLAQDAFEEPENNGYCLGTEILFALMYSAAANICMAVDAEPIKRLLWKQRGSEMMETIRREYWNEEAGVFTSGPRDSLAYENGWWESTGAEMALWPRFQVATTGQRDRFLSAIKANPNALSDFGINWYPFRKEKNHFWNACWVSWTLGIAVAAAEAGDTALLRTLIFQQVRNVMLNKTFHEVIDNETGRAWRWPGLPWHAAGFLGFFVYGVFGIRYNLEGLRFRPAVPKEFVGMKLRHFRYRSAEFDIELLSEGTELPVLSDGEPLKGVLGPEISGYHKIVIGA